MKVFISQDINAVAVYRTEDMLRQYAPPSIYITKNESEADVILLVVNGRLERYLKRAKAIRESGKQYIIHQLCIRSTQKPNTKDWLPLWKDALLVWSYYDIPYEMSLDNLDFEENKFNFHHSPLGANKYVFEPQKQKKEYVICTSGRHYLTEGARECIHAARAVGKRVAHLGGGIPESLDNVDVYSGITDKELVELYNKCEFVSGLRTKEGFELPAAEALLCGITPIMFDIQCYRQWYDGLAIFIPEAKRDKTVEALTDIFKKGMVKPTKKQIDKATKLFDWETIVRSFWKEICIIHSNTS